jgi:uncharacterized SAM-binding protein YcdF (DUF218 family)
MKFRPLIQIQRLFSFFGILLAGCLLLGGGLSYYFAAEVYDYQDTVDGAHLPEVDAIVCLAGGRGRIAAAGDLWYRYWETAQRNGPGRGHVPTLYFSGMGRQANWNAVSRQVRKGVLQVLKPNHVLIENESFNTDANARWLARFAQKLRWKRILLMTSSYHMRRARLIFDHVLKASENPIELETLSVYQEPFSPDEWRLDANGVRVTFMEYWKWLYYQSVWKSLGPS